MSARLRGKVAVTGAANGIGLRARDGWPATTPTSRCSISMRPRCKLRPPVRDCGNALIRADCTDARCRGGILRIRDELGRSTSC